MSSDKMPLRLLIGLLSSTWPTHAPTRLCYAAVMSRYHRNLGQSVRSKNYPCSRRCQYPTGVNYGTEFVMFCIFKRVGLEYSFL